MRILGKKIALVFSVVLLLILSVFVVKLSFFDKEPTLAAIQVDSFPRAEVLINGRKVGTTPYTQEKMTVGEYHVRLIPIGSGGTFYIWEGKVPLFGGGLTYISRDLGSTPSNGAGQMLYQRRGVNSSTGELIVVSTPDGAQVAVDGIVKGKASTIIKNLDRGNHDITITLTGFADQIVPAKIEPGYRLHVFVDLAPLQLDFLAADGSASARPTADLLDPSIATSGGLVKPYVVILDTPLGFLRLRKDPFITSPEIGQVLPKEQFPLLNEESGWVRIKRASDSGWVSDQYVEVIK